MHILCERASRPNANEDVVTGIYLDLIKEFINRGCFMNAFNTRQKTPLDLLMDNLNFKLPCIFTLLSAGSDVNRIIKRKKVYRLKFETALFQQHNRAMIDFIIQVGYTFRYSDQISELVSRYDWIFEDIMNIHRNVPLSLKRQSANKFRTSCYPNAWVDDCMTTLPPGFQTEYITL